ncbi:MAG: phosphodiester glycosidase family protein, partial [Flaviflexus sp.]
MLGEGQVGLFNHLWGDYTRDRALDGGTGTEILINPDGVVTSVGIPATGQLPEGVTSLVERDRAGSENALDAISVGDTLTVESSVTSDAGEISAAIGANAMLVADGEPVGSGTATAPRTAIGFNEAGTVMYLLVVDGRQASSDGLGLADLGVLMAELGIYSGANLDGGGSTTMGAVPPGETEAQIPHNPSDGYERPVPNGIGLYVERGSGEVIGYSISSLLQVGQPDRVFPGLTRQIQAKGYDETGSAVPGTVPAWSTSTGSVAVESNGDHTATLTGVAAGSDTVTASQNDANGTMNVQVLGELDRIELSPSVIQLSTSDEVGSFTVYGYDKHGYRAPIDANDVVIEGDEAGSFTIESGTSGTFAVTANEENAASPISVSVNGIKAEAALTVGVDTLPLVDFSDAAEWTAGQARAPGVTVTPAEGHEGKNGVAIDFDFTQSTGTRGAYAVAPNGGFEIPGQPTALTAWVNGNKDGAWPRIQV